MKQKPTYKIELIQKAIQKASLNTSGEKSERSIVFKDKESKFSRLTEIISNFSKVINIDITENPKKIIKKTNFEDGGVLYSIKYPKQDKRPIGLYLSAEGVDNLSRKDKLKIKEWLDIGFNDQDYKIELENMPEEEFINVRDSLPQEKWEFKDSLIGMGQYSFVHSDDESNLL